MDQGIEKIIEKVLKHNPSADTKALIQAFEFSSQIHKEQFRFSGDPFIIHPLEVANVLADLHQDVETISAGLLHDCLEDSDFTAEEMAQKFGKEVAKLVEGVTKLGKLVFKSHEERQAENFRKMFLAMGEDIRIVIIKLADRLHNMKTLEFLPPAKQKETALETREIFAPLAHRLGMWSLKWQLEDLSFSFLEPNEFEDIKTKVIESRDIRETYVQKFIKLADQMLSKVGISSEVYGRPKHFYSIYKKMVDQNLEFSDLYDLLAIRIIVPSIKECYAALGLIHSAWKPIPGRFHDYIAMPKSNGYQSLHTTVIGPGGKPVEVQIRTQEMHQVAEYGVAAHWRYKEKATDQKLDTKIAWLRQLLDWQKDFSDAKDFMDGLKTDLFEDEVFAFTPKGLVIDLPKDATPLDFAYTVHTEIGHRCIGAKVNGRIVPLTYKIKNGDIVEVLTGKNNNPKLDWLDFVKTARTRSKIKNWFRKQKKDSVMLLGKASLIEECEKLSCKISNALEKQTLDHLLSAYGAATTFEELLALIGHGNASAYQVAKKIAKMSASQAPQKSKTTDKPRKAQTRKKEKAPVKVMGLSNMLVKFAKCCHPLPGDEIAGLVTKGKGVAVHRVDCPNFRKTANAPEKIVPVSWQKDQVIALPIEIEVEAFDRIGLFKDILQKIVETKTNVAAANIKTKRGSTAIIKLVVDISDTEHLANLIAVVRSLPDVYSVKRVDLLSRR